MTKKTEWIKQPQQWWQAEALDTTTVGDDADSGQETVEETVDWDFIAASIEGDEDAIVAAEQKPKEETPTPPTPEPPAPPAPAAEPTTPPAQPPEQPPVAPATQELSTPAAAPQPPATPTPQQMEPQVLSPEALRQMQEAYVGELLPRYQLSDEDASNFVLNVKEVVPRLAATLHANISQQVVQDVTRALLTQLPQVIDSQVTRKQAAATAEQQFFDRWPELKQHREAVFAYGRIYRANNPGVKMDKFINDVGVQSWIEAKLPMNGLAAKFQSAPAAQPTQQQQPQRGYVPAATAQRSVPPAAQQPVNPFEQLSREMKEDFF